MLTPQSRSDMLAKFLPQGGVCAEIGVAKGNFSRLILDVNEPRGSSWSTAGSRAR